MFKDTVDEVMPFNGAPGWSMPHSQQAGEVKGVSDSAVDEIEITY